MAASSVSASLSSANPNQNHYGMSCGTTRTLPFGGKGSLSGQDHMSQTFKVWRLAESGHIWLVALTHQNKTRWGQYGQSSKTGVEEIKISRSHIESTSHDVPNSLA
jgi:hypothetical protein